MKTSKNPDIDKESELSIREIVEIDGEVEISRDGEFLIIESVDSKVLN